MARQRKKGNPIVTAVIFGIFGIVLLFLGIRTFIGLHGTLLNVTTCDPSEIKPGIYVEGTISYGYGAYIEKTTTYNHIVTKTDGYYYLVDICDKNADGSDNDTARWIGISISKSDNDKFDAISTQDDAPPIEITGVIRKNSSKVQGFLDDYITSYVDMYASYYDYTATSEDYANAKAEAFPYYIEMVDSSDYIFNLVLGLIFVLVAVFIVFKATRSKNHISAPAQPAGTAYYNGSGYFNGINATGYVYQPGNTYGMYTPGMSNMDNTSYLQHQTTTPQTPYNDPFYSQQPTADELQATDSTTYGATDTAPLSSSFTLKSDD